MKPIVRSKNRPFDRRLLRSERGNVAVVFALSMPLVAGGAAFGVESTYWYFKDLELQSAADAAAYAAAIQRRAGSQAQAVTAVALREATANGFTPSLGTIQVNAPPQSGPNQGADAVEVVLTERQNRFFTDFFSNDTVTARARSVAVFQSASNACVLALDRSASRAAQFSGSSSLTLQGCSVMANSVASDAVVMQGSATASTTCLISVGGAQTTSGLTLTECAAPVTQAPPVADPYGELPEPSASGSCLSANGSSLAPGNYCNGMSLSGNVTLQPGTYVVSGGNFRVNSNAVVSGNGVTIHLTGTARTRFNGNATVQLSAPTSGAYSGILFFGDRDSTGDRNIFNGTANSSLTGAIYFPSQAVEYQGNFSGVNGCTQIVANTVEWTGNATFNVDCTGQGMQTLPAMQLVKLAE
ncbi:MAG TPA: pilus assembly protein TadG-related protein [Caulobacteraceae bacterium]|nr:pilus assembly protein TadG-related protein [Caulobacteraceae bacterium]